MKDLVDGVLEQEETMRETLEEMEEWFRDTVANGESIMAGDRLDRIRTLTGSSYEALSQEALKLENVEKCMRSMTTQIAFHDKGGKCKIKWVKM